MTVTAVYRQTRNYENLHRALFEGVGDYGIPEIIPLDCEDVENWISFNFAKTCDATDIQQLATFMSDNYGIRMDTSTFANQDFENVRIAASAVEHIAKEFPGAANLFHELKGEQLRPGAMASASFSGIIRLSDNYFGDRNNLLSRYQNAVNNGFHPAGSNGDHVATHEAGHILERALIGKYAKSYIEEIQAWKKCTYATKVIQEASRAAKKTPEGKGMTINEHVQQVSGYATKNRSEALAECVADYVANGSKAKPLSVAVWSVLKRELG